jgi:hypothetical protein
VDDAGFEKQPNASRLVVLIGDHGNRGTPNYDGLVEKLTRPGRSPIDFVAVQVVDPEKLPDYEDQERARRARQAARDFRDQLTTLVERLNQKSAQAGAGRRIGTFVPMPDEGQGLTELLDEKYDEMKKREDELRRVQARLSARSFPTKVGSELEGLLADRGVSLERIRSLVGVRMGQEGYVWRWSRPPVGDEPGIAQVRVEALLSRPEVEKLVGLVAPILSSADPLKALQKAVGQDKSASVEKKWLSPSGLPATSLMFRRSIESLTPELVDAELPAARERLAHLRALLNDQGSASSQRWFDLHPGSTRWCWIDAATELP